MKKWSPLNEANKKTVNIDKWGNLKILKYSLKELDAIKNAIGKRIKMCEKVASLITDRVSRGGRVLTIGAGGSGVAGMSVMRELPQNHRNLSPTNFFYIIAGNKRAFNPFGCEELEDDFDHGYKTVQDLTLDTNDTIILLSATGRTPFILGAVKSAKNQGALTVGISCCESELISKVDLPIFLDVGPEIFVGATCEKAATAQKHVLDMIMNVVVVRLGITKKNICQARLVHKKAQIREHFFNAK